MDTLTGGVLQMKTGNAYVLLAVLGSLLSSPAHAERQIAVNFTTATLTITDSQMDTLLETPIVLPRADFYRLPATGMVAYAEMYPSWTPTPEMHRSKPGKYKTHYRPRENGNAMGHCKVTIHFDADVSVLQYVRIHGNAKETDLGQRRSAGCIRIPDDVCPMLVAISTRESPVRVIFER